MAAPKEVSVDAAIASVISELESISSLKVQKTALIFLKVPALFQTVSMDDFPDSFV